VIFTRHVYRPGRADEGQNLTALSATLAEIDRLAAGSWDGGVVDELGWTPADLTVDLQICGVVTNICVESTVRALGVLRPANSALFTEGTRPRLLDRSTIPTPDSLAGWLRVAAGTPCLRLEYVPLRAVPGGGPTVGGGVPDRLVHPARRYRSMSSREQRC
jgi:hypothetical protein